MLALTRQKGALSLSEVDAPRPTRDEALIRVHMAGICNTDLEIVRGYMDFEGVLGHEFVGVVEECSDPDWLGARVAGEINLACRQCNLCQRGLERHCPNRRVLGILGKDGAFAEYLTLPTHNLHRVPEGLSDREACFVEPIAACFEIVEQVPMGPHNRVAVLGDGKLGTLAALVLNSYGVCPVLVGKHASKRARAQLMGIQTATADELTPKTYDIVVEATGHPSGMSLATKLVRPRGTIVLKSTYHGELAIQAAPWVIDELTVVGSRCGPFPPALAQLGSGQVTPDALIDAVFPLQEAQHAFERAAEPSVLKVLLQMPLSRDRTPVGPLGGQSDAVVRNGQRTAQ